MRAGALPQDAAPNRNFVISSGFELLTNAPRESLAAFYRGLSQAT